MSEEAAGRKDPRSPSLKTEAAVAEEAGGELWRWLWKSKCRSWGSLVEEEAAAWVVKEVARLRQVGDGAGGGGDDGGGDWLLYWRTEEALNQ